MIGVLVSVDGRGVNAVSVKNELFDLYDLLKCSYIDIVHRRIGGKTYAMVCDDEGALKSDAKVSAFYETGAPALFGNILIVKDNKKGDDVISLTDKECTSVMSSTVAAGDRTALIIDNPRGRFL